jgi:hypothetical protein
MPSATITPDDVLSSLLAARPVRLGTAEATDAIEHAFGSFDPAPALLRETIDAVFWASLSAEEGRPALVRVRFADIREPNCLLEPRSISSAALRKLSPLMDVSSNGLYVRKDGHIVGVGPWRGDVGIVAHRPGHLAVVDGSIVLGVFDEGNWVIVSGSETNLSQILGRSLPREPFRERFLKATLIVRLAMRARRAGRGATFVIIPAERREGIGSISYPVAAFSALPQALDAWRQASQATPPMNQRDQIRGLVGNAIAVVAAGSGIDGATLIDDTNLRLVGFGAKISAPEDEIEVAMIELPNTEVHRIQKKYLGGMRHQTAARLVQLNHEAMVITVSQDGPVSLFAWVQEDAVVSVIKHLDRYLLTDASLDR